MNFVLVYDAPNIDQTLSLFLGGIKPSPDDRPDLKAIMRWLKSRAGDDDDNVRACVFANVPEGDTEPLRRWLHFLRGAGYHVFLKPKKDEDDDIDDKMLEFIKQQIEQVEDNKLEIVVVSNDAQNFFKPLRQWVEDGHSCLALGFKENAGELSGDDLIEFIDLEDEDQIPGVFKSKIPNRINVSLNDLPTEGMMFEPLKPLW